MGLLGKGLPTFPPSLQGTGKSGSTEAGRAHCKRLSEEKVWFLGRNRPVTARAEGFVYGFGLMRNPFQCFSTTAVLTAGKVLLRMFLDPKWTEFVPERTQGVCRLLFSVQTGLSKKPGFLLSDRPLHKMQNWGSVPLQFLFGTAGGCTGSLAMESPDVGSC